MKKSILFFGLLFGTASFAQVQPPIVGNDSDAHGCKASAGYTYSQIKKDCIQVFEEKIKLSEVKSNGGMMAAVILSKDMKKAEIFIAEEKTSVILNRQGKAKMWKSGSYVLVPSKNKSYQIKKDNVVIYQ